MKNKKEDAIMTIKDQYVFALAHGASEIWYYEDWIKTPGVAIVSCNDGLRPVIMKLEATGIEADVEN